MVICKMIPTKLKKEEFRFVILKRKDKIPFEMEWQSTTNYKFDDPRLLTWIAAGNNYGVIGGFGNIIIIDFDDKEFEEQHKKLLPETFTVKTGSGGTHLYYKCDNAKSFKILDKDKNTLADIQGQGKQCVAPGSIHPCGGKYEVINDVEIATIPFKKLQIVFSKHLKQRDKFKLEHQEDDIVKQIKSEISLKELLGKYGYDLSKNPTMCQLGHASKGKACFSFSDEVFYCHHCDEGGDQFNLVMAKEGVGFLEARKILAKMANISLPSYMSNNKPALMITSYIDNVIEFFDHQPFFYDKSKMFWLWNSNICSWDRVDEIDLMNLIDKQLGLMGQTVTSSTKANYLEAFKRVGRERMPEDPPITWVQFKDKIFDIKTKQIIKATPKYFMCNPIPFEINDDSNTPTIDKLFREWVGEKHVQTLHEIIAYCCIIDYPIHLLFCLVGVGRNGKSRFQALVNKFIGTPNICSTELDLLIENRFESAKLYKKLVCLLGETNFGVLKKTSLLKKLCGQDLIGYEFKNKNPFDDMNYATILISSNSMPPSIDTSEGFYRRWFIIDFPNKFDEGKDILQTIPENEFKALSRKVIEILPKLLEDGKFTNQGTIEERRAKYIMASNPLPFFLQEFCDDSDPNEYMLYGDLYKAYIKYLKAKDRRVVSRKEFSKVLAAEGLIANKTSKKTDDGDFHNGYFIDGITLKTDYELQVHSK